MKILVVGSGGREHAIGLKLSESRHQPQLYFAPGNPGVEMLGQRLEIEVADIQGLCLFARREKINLAVVGPEVPLSLGVGDASSNGYAPVGETNEAARNCFSASALRPAAMYAFPKRLRVSGYRESNAPNV